MFVKDNKGDFVRCPECGSVDVRYSDSVRPLDLIQYLLRKHAVRCRHCRTRFYARTNEAANKMWVDK